jgi:bifunctional UDP-N-acetylglucosamine pyrophosphorylase/glucosamine-1-phosphate N-acetyltransferase
MQAVIFAAGKGTRLAPFTETRPKPLLKVVNKTILEHNLDQLVGISDHVFIVVNQFKEQIIAQIGQDYKGIRITFVDQEKPLGTGDAIKSALPFLDKKFIVIYGDDVYFREGIEKVIKKSPCILLKEVKNPESFGVVTVMGNKVTGLIEKPDKPVSNLVNMGVYFLEKDIFSIEIQPTERGEYELVDYLKPLIAAGKLNFEIGENWFPITYPWSLLDANAFLLERLEKPLDKLLEKEEKIKGLVEENCHIKENVWIGEGTVVKSGSYIEKNVVIGKNCKVGPNCYIRSGTSIGDGCHVGQAVELKNTIIFDKSNVPHLSYVGDTVMGSNSNLGAGTITANLRHDGANVRSMVKGVLVDTGRRKLGAIIGDNVKTGSGTIIYPGRKLWPGARTVPQENIKEDRK